MPDDEESPEGRVKLTLSRDYLKSDGETDGQSGRMVYEKCGFPRFPPLLVRVQLQCGTIRTVSLSFRKEGFSFSIEGDGPSTIVESWIQAYSGLKQPLASLPPLHCEKLSSFSKKVYYELLRIPFGYTISYKELASRIGSPKAVRAVGRACGANPFPLFVPCHRVIHSNGALGGFAFGQEIKIKLLLFEKCC